MKFKWGKDKAARNASDHGVTFNEAATVFDDPYFVVLTDDEHSFSEQRYWIIGESEQAASCWLSIRNAAKTFD